ncbi:flagellar hook-associated protein FlgL [Cryobacterium luteum]|uniref:Flagellar hook-associated protein 3 n=1 Tax=Cryobacterium luteum TaxID=1424661 RepID=A0A1H8GXT2_9MICO|nr:flagellar hook-associated protein FlgL [Cryobacterium luteum]TFB84557.1 flagellar hook-associated protein 3 [Cryobacterium luteum]SEN48892.1 flagellar hook-associated protein 3 FlgL [Cryobacterium luteum]
MVERVTTQTQMRSAQRNLQANMTHLARLQEQASTLKTINRSSDDPTAAAAAMSVRAEMRAVDQYSANADNGNDWLTTIESSLGFTSDIMNRVRFLTVQGANSGALSATAKEAIAIEIEGLKTDLLTQANTKFLGRSVFAGNSDDATAFATVVDSTGVTTYPYSGDPAGEGGVERRISATSTVRVDAEGGTIFGTGTASVFGLLDNIVTDLRSGAEVSSHLNGLDDRMAIMTGQRSEIGARQVQMERAQSTLLEKTGTLDAQRSGIEDADLGQVIIDLKLQEVTYQAALAVTARVLQPTLMDFLS